MKRVVSFFIIMILFAFSSFAQKNIVVIIGDKKFTKDEYERVYVKNNTQLSDESEVKTPEEYLDLFINYKLKVIEAEKHGLDTLETFRTELAGYREELAKPYLTDISISDTILKETYYRTNHLIKASHILLEVSPDASPSDTLIAYNKLMDIRNQFINKEKSFEELAFEFSEDPSAKQNKGDLGYFKAFNMITQFENVAYNTKKGEVSMPFRTNYGFHIIYVTDQQELTGEVKIAHIMKMYKNRNNHTEEEDIQYKHELDSLYNLLQNGADFAELAKENSDDKNSARNGGEMGFISRTFNVPDFVDYAYALKEDGEFTRPVKTIFGWHIIKRIGFKNPLTFEEVKADLTDKIKKDPLRSNHSKELYFKKKKEEFHFVEYDENIAAFKNYITNLYVDTIFNEIFPDEILAMKLYQIENNIYTVDSYYSLVKKLNETKSKLVIKLFFNQLDKYDETVITEYMNDHLETLYPEFATIMQEYHDGMLLFSIMEKEVWNKAVLDTLGLQSFYEQNKGQYKWEDHFEGLWIRCYNQNAVDSCKKLLDEGIVDPVELETRINVNSSSNIRVSEGKWEKGTNKRIDYLVFSGEKPERFNDDFEFVKGEIKKAGDVKTLDEAKGLYISDYQQVLENKWIEKLRSSYKVSVNKKLLKQVKSL